jgi:hypothetical protein
MTANTPTPPDDKRKPSNRIKQRLILLGIALAIFGACDVSYLIYRIAHPSL